jgi:hypothetical protein
VTRTRIPDRETSALARARKVAEKYGLTIYHQGDPRGCSLYVGPATMTGDNYNTVGVPCMA